MPPRWNTWAGIQTVQFDWEKEPKERQVRLLGGHPKPAINGQLKTGHFE